jgi:hypothetical protein
LKKNLLMIATFSMVFAMLTLPTTMNTSMVKASYPGPDQDCVCQHLDEEAYFPSIYPDEYTAVGISCNYNGPGPYYNVFYWYEEGYAKNNYYPYTQDNLPWSGAPMECYRAYENILQYSAVYVYDNNFAYDSGDNYYKQDLSFLEYCWPSYTVYAWCCQYYQDPFSPSEYWYCGVNYGHYIDYCTASW